MLNSPIGREEIALALSADIVAPQLVSAAFGQSGIEVPRYAAILKMVTTPIRLRDFGKRSAARVNDGSGYPTFAELFVAARLRATGWASVWVSPFGGLRCIHDWAWNASEPLVEQLPRHITDRLVGIAELRRQKRREQKASFNGIPDVIGWRRDDLIMIECKRAGADSLGPNQDAWMHCAILSGCRREQLGVFEWRFDHGN